MSDFSLTLVLQIKTSKIINDMAKLQQKSEKISAFGGIFHVREQFSRFVGPVIDKVLDVTGVIPCHMVGNLGGDVSHVEIVSCIS